MQLVIESLNAEHFAPFGEVIELRDHRDRFDINDGYATRLNDLCRVELLGSQTRPLVNLFHGRPRALRIEMLERHPYGSQAFLPLQPFDWWVVVAEQPTLEALRLFRARGDQGVNYRPGTWHHPLLVDRQQSFLVVDRTGEENNLEEVILEGVGVWER